MAIIFKICANEVFDDKFFRRHITAYRSIDDFPAQGPVMGKVLSYYDVMID